MASKKKVENKGEKKPVQNKSIDWSGVSDPCTVVFTANKGMMKKGAESVASKAAAKVLVESGKATVK
jgi:hypothetical protein